MDSFIESVETYAFAKAGELANAKQAIAENDLATLVKSSLTVVKKSGMGGSLTRRAEHKSTKASKKYRREGNKYYNKKHFINAIQCYNQALAYAPNDSLELKLAYSNISAVMYSIGMFKACLMNIEAALKLDCPDSLRTKLEKRMNEAGTKITQEALLFDFMMSDENMLNYAQFNVERNDLPCATKAVTVVDGKVVAAKTIKSGTLVVMERAFVSIQNVSARYTSCYYCHKMGFFFIPCKGCSKALFCSKKCQEKCLEEYHRIECAVVDYLYLSHMEDENGGPNKLALKAALQMSLKLGWEELSAASLDMGKSRLESKKNSISEAFDRGHPTSLLCYDDSVQGPEHGMINRALFCASALYLINDVPNYWPADEQEKKKAIESLSRIILHLNTTFTRRIKIVSSAININLDRRPVCTAAAQTNEGWFSLSSKLPHSCEPNLLVVGFNDHVGLVATERIKKGEPLTICYIDHFYEMRLPPSPRATGMRQEIIEFEIKHKCQCRVCIRDWDLTSPVDGKLTARQKVAYNVCELSLNTPDFKRQMRAISAALDELTGCSGTKDHRDVYVVLKHKLVNVQCFKDENKCYGMSESLNFDSMFNKEFCIAVIM